MQPDTTEVSAGKIGVINGLRGLAILAVITRHLIDNRIISTEHEVVVGPFSFFSTFIFTNGFQGVGLFFILSGFVLALPYLRGQRSIHSLADVRALYARRLRRLGPLYVLCALISMIFVYPHELITAVPMMFTMAFTFTNDAFFPLYNGVLWSLAVEVLFSLALPVIIVAIGRYGMRTVLMSAVVLATATRLFSSFIVLYHPLRDGLPGRIDDFMWGVFLAYLYVHHKHKSVPFALPIGLSLLFIACQMFDLDSALRHMGAPYGTYERLLYPLAFSFSNIGLFLCVDGVLRGRHRFVMWFLEGSLIQTLGLMSYSLYVWYDILIRALSAQMDFVHVVRYFIMLGLLSLVSYRFVEFGHIADFRKLLPSPRTVRFPLASWFRTSETPSTHPS